jgi:AcrR family transcriptional regulator
MKFMAVPDFQRARSAEAKQQREDAILDAARALGAERGIRQITLADIGEAVGLHKSAMLRYFETREEIFLRLTADGWREWSAALRAALGELLANTPAAVASVFARTLAARGLFCDLLAQAPLNLERHVSLDAVRAFKLVTLAEVGAIVAVVRRLLPALTERDGVDLIAAATAMAGAFWQMATPRPEVAALYRSDSRLAHAVVDVEPRLARLLAAMLAGMLA